MNCFRHRNEPAIAICKHCGKAACETCCEDSGQGIACSLDCLLELQEEHLLQNRIKQSLGVGTRPPMPASVSTYFFFGFILSVTGVYLTMTRPGIDFLTFAMAAVFFVMSLAAFKRYRDGCTTC